MNPIIAPSLLASDFSNLEREVTMINESEADWIHIDIMDGVFVPNISIGIPVVEAIRRHAKKTMDVHLMIINPDRYLAAFRDAGADIITIHIEACPQLLPILRHIRELGARAGIAVNPCTPVFSLEPFVMEADVIDLMSVNPGFGGQKLIEDTYEKIRDVRKLIRDSGSKALIEIDGGVNLDNAGALMDAGADVLVAGNFVFNAANPAKIISQLKAISIR